MLREHTVKSKHEINPLVEKIISETNKQELGSYDCIYVRTSDKNSDIFTDKSIDVFIVENPSSEEETSDLICKYDLEGEPILVNDNITRKKIWGIKYNGVHASDQFNDQTELIFDPNNSKVDIFIGEYVCDNLQDDGVIVYPKKLIATIETSF